MISLISHTPSGEKVNVMSWTSREGLENIQKDLMRPFMENTFKITSEQYDAMLDGKIVSVYPLGDFEIPTKFIRHPDGSYHISFDHFPPQMIVLMKRVFQSDGQCGSHDSEIVYLIPDGSQASLDNLLRFVDKTFTLDANQVMELLAFERVIIHDDNRRSVSLILLNSQRGIQ